MPTCEHCGSDFPWSTIIDGKRRNLGTRKNCLKCSPFGSHNTRPINLKLQITGECNICNRLFEYDKLKGHRRTICNSCSVRRYQRDKKKKAVDHYGGKCVKCGYNKCLEALDFHHRNNVTKLASPSQVIMKWTWEKAVKELDKCDLLCANCHRETHAEKYVEVKAKIQAWKDASAQAKCRDS